MAKRGRYAQRTKRSSTIIPAIVLVLIFLTGFVFFRIGRNRNDADLGMAGASEITELLQTTQQTFSPEERILQQEQTTEPEVITPVTMEPMITETIETEAIVETFRETDRESRSALEDEIDCYATVLQQYREVMMMDSAEFMKLYGNESELDLELSIDSLRRLAAQGELASIIGILERPTLSARYPYVNAQTLRFFHSAKMDNHYDSCDPTNYHYAYYDIDGKRCVELLIGEYNDYRDNYEILAIYTIAYEEPRLLQFVTDDSRWHLTIYTDGTICLDGSGGASLHHWKYYRMHETFDMDELVASFEINYDSPGGEYMASAVKGYEAMLTPVEDIIWQQLIEG